MYTKPIKKINGVNDTKDVIYYYSRGYDRNGREMLEKRKGSKQQFQLQLKRKMKTEEEEKKYYSNAQTLYHIESLKIRNSKIYRKTNGEDIETGIIESKASVKSKIAKMLKAYNKSIDNKKMIDLRKKYEKEHPSIITKKEEIKKFKESLKPGEKTELDKACEEFEEALRRKSKTEIKEIQKQYRRRNEMNR